MIDQRKKITFYYDNENSMKEIDLFPEQRYIKDFRDFNLDVTLVEILPKDNIIKDYFLIMILTYSQGGEFSCSVCSIKK